MYLGVFFVGAYQETLGDLHNLFGDTNICNRELNPDGSFEMMHEQEGDTVSEVLTMSNMIRAVWSIHLR